MFPNYRFKSGHSHHVALHVYFQYNLQSEQLPPAGHKTALCIDVTLQTWKLPPSVIIV